MPNKPSVAEMTPTETPWWMAAPVFWVGDPPDAVVDFEDEDEDVLVLVAFEQATLDAILALLERVKSAH